MIPILAGFIAFSIADRPGIAPAAIAGMVGNVMGAGFLGALAAGLIGGVVVYYLKKIKLPKALLSLKTIFIIPIVGTFITAGLMQWVIGVPITGMTEGLTNWLNSMSTGSIVILAIIMGAMNAFDMGGPVNKVAFAFTIMAVSNGNYEIAGINGVGTAVPSLGVGVATFIASKKFTNEEKEAGKAGFLMGLIGITEGAIPFAASDPLRVIPANMVGGAVGCAVAAILGVTNKVAWGGIIVLPAVTNGIGLIIALATGTAVSAILIAKLKKPVENRVESEEKLAKNFELDIEL